MTAQHRGNAPAFPRSATHGSDYLPSGDPGMTLREYYAGQAMVGLLGEEQHTGLSPSQIADMAVNMADALLEKLSR